MGGTTSKIYGKLSRSWTSASCSSENLENTAEMCRSPSSVGPFVFTRRGSQFFDEDGDLAHEFYEEVRVEELIDSPEEAAPTSSSTSSSSLSRAIPSSSSSSSSASSSDGGVQRRRCRLRMRRKFRNLSPQGIVDLQFPRLHGDLPVVLCHVTPSQ